MKFVKCYLAIFLFNVRATTSALLMSIDHFRYMYIKIHTWIRGLGEYNKETELFIPELQYGFFSPIPLGFEF